MTPVPISFLFLQLAALSPRLAPRCLPSALHWPPQELSRASPWYRRAIIRTPAYRKPDTTLMTDRTEVLRIQIRLPYQMVRMLVEEFREAI